MSTIESKRAAVIAYCEEVCPRAGLGKVTVEGITLEWVDYGGTMNGGLRLYGVVDWMYISPQMGDHTTEYAYRVLRLSERDAVKAQNQAIEEIALRDGIIKNCREALEAELARSAKLVEDVERINKAYGTTESFNRGLGSRIMKTSVGYAISRALEAYKKGGVQG